MDLEAGRPVELLPDRRAETLATWLKEHPGVQLVTRFLVRNHQADIVDAIRNLYTRRLAWCAPDDPARMSMIRARLDAERVASTYKGNPIGVPTFLLGGAVISGLASGFRIVGEAALGSRLAAGLAVATAFLVLAALSWMILRGAAVAHHRIRITTDAPVRALWETIGRCGNPPEDDAQTFAVYAIILTVVGWLLIPLGQASLYAYAVHLFVIVAAYNVWPYVGSEQAGWELHNTIGQLLLVLLVWAMVKRRVLFSLIPR